MSATDPPLWYVLRCTAPAQAEDLLCAWLHELTGRGASVTGAGARVEVSGYLPAPEPAAAVRAELLARWAAFASDAGLPGDLHLATDTVCEEDWAENWKAWFHPLRLGERFVIKPTWEPWPPPDQPDLARPDDLVLELDPAMAFGTGTHATTQLCLEALERYLRPGQTVADLGCGSGILALGAARLGAARVEGWEIDPVAVRACAENFARNGVEGVCSLVLGDALTAWSGAAEVVLANLNTHLLLQLLPTLATHLRPGGVALLSGTTESSLPALREAAVRAGLAVRETRLREEWALLVLSPMEEKSPAC